MLPYVKVKLRYARQVKCDTYLGLDQHEAILCEADLCLLRHKERGIHWPGQEGQCYLV